MTFIAEFAEKIHAENAEIIRSDTLRYIYSKPSATTAYISPVDSAIKKN